MLAPVYTKKFEKDLARARKRGNDLEKIKEVIRVLVIFFMTREPDIIRVISMRKAGKEERKGYEEAIKNRLGTH
jgi:uncharacterized DUF497 family protein